MAEKYLINLLMKISGGPVGKKKYFNIARIMSPILNYSRLRMNGDEGTG